MKYWGEEMTEAEQQRVIDHSVENTDVDGYWCIDPLDGTSNFAARLPSLCGIHSLNCE